MKRPPVQEKSVLVTGCSSGIGRATARMLRERGWNVLPTARKPEDLEELRAEGFDPVRLDVADRASVDEAAKAVLARLNGRLGALVNNAGFGQAGAAEDLTREALGYQMEVNFIGVHDLTRRFLPAMRAQGWGRIVNVSSVLGRIVIPFYGAYCASKYAMEGLTDAMRIELWRTGIGVSLIEPGPIVSEFRRNAAYRAQESIDLSQAKHAAYYDKEIQRRIKQQKKPDFFTLPPEAVAEKIFHAISSSHPKTRYRVTIPAYLGTWAGRFAPDWLLDAFRTRKLPDAAQVP